MEKSDTYIIAVDDEEDILELYDDAFSVLGYKVITATSGKSAFEAIQQHHAKLLMVISDMQMPEMDGVQLREKMLEDYAHIPFAIVSGNVTKELALKGVDTKICAFVSKPFTKDSLEELVKKKAEARFQQMVEDEEMLLTFLEEANELLVQIEETLLEFEQDYSDLSHINQLMRLLHTVKGTSGCMGFSKVSEFAHKFEDMFTDIRDQKVPSSPDVVSVTFDCFDVLKEMFDTLKEAGSEDYDIKEKLQIIALPQAGAAPAQGAKTTDRKAKKEVKTKKVELGDSVKVSTQLLDTFMAMSGDLTVVKNSIFKTVQKMERDFPRNSVFDRLKQDLAEMNKISSDMQKQIVDVRKVDVKSIFKPFKRLVRDVGKATGKEIDLTTEGTELRVDTSIAQVLNNGLIHMIRNSCDHGIEKPDIREQCGKNPQGNVRLAAKTTEEFVIVELEDDGAGLHMDRIKNKAIENQLHSAEELAAMSDSEIYALIFASGFSTAAEVTDISGRGVGMDMVRSSVEAAGGWIDIESTLGKGTKFSLNIPVPKTVNILWGLLIHLDGNVFALPQNEIKEVVRINTDKIYLLEEIDGHQFLRLRDDLIPIIDVESILGIERNFPFPRDEVNMIIFNVDQNIFGIKVDEVLDNEEVVVKKLDHLLSNLPEYRGSTLIGDGEVVLILDPKGLAEQGKLTLIDSRTRKDKIIEDDVAGITEHEHGSFILVEITGGTQYAVNLNHIHRLESFRCKDIEYSANHYVVHYLNKTMPLIDVGTFLNQKPLLEERLKTTEHCEVLVVTNDEKEYGIVVQDIVDIVAPEAPMDTKSVKHESIEGVIFSEGHTIASIDVNSIVVKALEAKVRRAERAKDTA